MSYAKAKCPTCYQFTRLSHTRYAGWRHFLPTLKTTSIHVEKLLLELVRPHPVQPRRVLPGANLSRFPPTTAHTYTSVARTHRDCASSSTATFASVHECAGIACPIRRRIRVIRRDSHRRKVCCEILVNLAVTIPQRWTSQSADSRRMSLKV